LYAEPRVVERCAGEFTVSHLHGLVTGAELLDAYHYAAPN
jgi:hypothetical protein